MTETQWPVVGFDQTIGLEFVEITPDGVVATLDIKPHLHQPYGIVHGGVLCTVVETVGSVSGAAWYTDGVVVGTSNTTNFIRATREGTLTARSTPVQRGRTQQLWDVDITDREGRLIARGSLRLANLPDSERLAQKP